jgi:hypothetical protein
MTVTDGKAEAIKCQGRKALRLTTPSRDGGFAFLMGIQVQ